jgi:hypothetical protein
LVPVLWARFFLIAARLLPSASRHFAVLLSPDTGPTEGCNVMSDDLSYQLRVTLNDEFAPVARSKPDDPSIAPLTSILHRHDATLKCQFDAFADYVSEAEAKGVEKYPLYEWTKATIEDAAKKEKYIRSFTLYVGGREVYDKDEADALEADLKPLVGGPIVAKMFKYDSNPANSPQPPRKN